MRCYEGHRHYPIRKTTLLAIQNGSSKGETNGIDRSHAMKKTGLAIIVGQSDYVTRFMRKTDINLYIFW